MQMQRYSVICLLLVELISRPAVADTATRQVKKSLFFFFTHVSYKYTTTHTLLIYIYLLDLCLCVVFWLYCVYSIVDVDLSCRRRRVDFVPSRFRVAPQRSVFSGPKLK